jgi:hypothetical protein
VIEFSQVRGRPIADGSLADDVLQRLEPALEDLDLGVALSWRVLCQP